MSSTQIELPKSGPYPAALDAQEFLFEQVKQLGACGKSHAQIARKLGISRITLQEWISEHPEFAAAMATADDYALAWWESLGQRQAKNREGNATMIMFVMKNRFDRDYGKEMPGETPQADVKAVTELSAKTRQKLRKLLLAETDSEEIASA